MTKDSRNLNPTPEARLAMAMWGGEYARQRGGSMDFWDGLDTYRQRVCIGVVRGIAQAAIAHCRTLEDMAQEPRHDD